MDINTIMSFGLDKAKATELFSNIEKFILEKVEKEKEALQKSYEAKIFEMNLKFYIESELIKSGCRSIKATMAFIDFEKLDKTKIDKNTIRKLIIDLKENEETRFLFFEQDDNIRLKGFKPLESNINKYRNVNPTSYEELCRYYEKGIR